MGYCTIHGAEDVPGCPECEENPAERLQREDVELDENRQEAAKAAAKALTPEEKRRAEAESDKVLSIPNTSVVPE